MTGEILNESEISVNEKCQLFRQQRLLSLIQSSAVPCLMDKLAIRIIDNMTGEDCPWKDLHHVFKKSPPFDSANPLKKSIYLELMPSVGEGVMYEKVWNQLDRAFTAGAQNGKLMALVVGVSGMGKTKIAYDIGKSKAFSIIARIVERDAFTLPWTLMLAMINDVELSILEGSPAVSEKHSLVSCIILLLVAHLQFAIDLSDALVKNEKYQDLLESFISSQRNGSGSVEDTVPTQVRELILKEAVLRCQRNGLAYAHVHSRFQTYLSEAIKSRGVISAQGVFILPIEYAICIMRQELERATDMWGADAKIVWFYDEVQAIMNRGKGIFKGTFLASSSSSDTHNELAPGSPGCNYDLLYGLMVAVRTMMQQSSQGHVFLGNSSKLRPAVFDLVSPAQGCCVSYEEAFHLDKTHILALLGKYLSDKAMECINHDFVEKLRGRPLFISNFWCCLLARVEKGGEKVAAEDTLKKSINDSLSDAYNEAITDAEDRIDRMWNDFSPSTQSSTSVHGLLAALFHSVLMESGTGSIKHFTDEIQAATTRGILNCQHMIDNSTLDREPVTKEALLRLGKRRISRGTDGVMDLLAARVRMPMGSEKCDFGEVLESCFSWYLVRQCILAESSISLSRLLAPFLAQESTCLGLNYPILEEYEVNLKFGHRWDSSSQKSPFEVLEGEKECLIHHPADAMAGPDVLHTAKKKGCSETLPVIYQLKNRSSGTLLNALASLDLGRMHPDGANECKAHGSMRAVLEKNPNWLSSIRVVVSAKGYHPSVLQHVAWFNLSQWQKSPLLLLTVNEGNLGVPITPATKDAISPYGPPKDWADFWPTGIRHSNIQSPFAGIDKKLGKVSPTIRLSWNVSLFGGMSKDAILGEIRKITNNGVIDSVVCHRLPGSMSITFEHVTDAFALVTQKKLSINGKSLNCTFA